MKEKESGSCNKIKDAEELCDHKALPINKYLKLFRQNEG